MPIDSSSVQRYVLVPSSILTDSERNALLDRSRLNAASSTVSRIERQIASIASNPTLSSEHKAEQLKSAVSGLDSATRDYLHTVADANVNVADEPMMTNVEEEESSSITEPYYTRPLPDQAPIAPAEESLAGRETLIFQQPVAIPTMTYRREPVKNPNYFANFKNKFTRSGRRTNLRKRLIDEI
uniref:Uncharacterized protein n=1 Tax=Plectus sambesii TaxID=2011161 RepID=A0A914WSP4_9BILA